MPGSDRVRADARDALREFLSERRARVRPEQVGLAPGRSRRVPGLRREEVALLAGISVEYYSRLERGTATGVSESVVTAVARVLGLDQVERAHLDELLRTLAAPGRDRSTTPTGVRAGVRRLLTLMPEAAAFARNGRLDVLAANELGTALYSDLFEAEGTEVPNLAHYLFADPRSRDFYADWPTMADAAVGSLRAELGRAPHDEQLHALVGRLRELDDFERRWLAHDVVSYRSGRQGFHDARVGYLELDYEALELPVDPGLTVLVYSAEPGSAQQQRLRQLLP